MSSGTNPWYQAWLQPDCMVGARTEDRLAMMRNKPLSDRLKQSLKKCMDTYEMSTQPAGSQQPNSVVRETVAMAEEAVNNASKPKRATRAPQGSARTKAARIRADPSKRQGFEAAVENHAKLLAKPLRLKKLPTIAHVLAFKIPQFIPDYLQDPTMYTALSHFGKPEDIVRQAKSLLQ